MIQTFVNVEILLPERNIQFPSSGKGLKMTKIIAEVSTLISQVCSEISGKQAGLRLLLSRNVESRNQFS